MKPLPMTLQAFAIQAIVPRMTMSGWDSDTRHEYKLKLAPLRTRKGEQSCRDATQMAVHRMFVPPPPPPQPRLPLPRTLYDDMVRQAYEHWAHTLGFARDTTNG